MPQVHALHAVLDVLRIERHAIRASGVPAAEQLREFFCGVELEPRGELRQEHQGKIQIAARIAQHVHLLAHFEDVVTHYLGKTPRRRKAVQAEQRTGDGVGKRGVPFWSGGP